MKTEARIPLSPFHCPLPFRRLTLPGETEAWREGGRDGERWFVCAAEGNQGAITRGEDKGIGTKELEA